MAKNDVDINIKLDSKDAVKGLKKVKNEIKKTDLAVASFLGNLGADVFKEFASAAGSAFFSVFNQAAQLESVTKVFASLTGSMETATRVVGELREFAATTPFEINGLNDSAKLLLTLSDITEDNVIPTLKRLGEASALGSKDILALTRAFVKTNAQGRLTGEVLETLTTQSPLLASALVKASGLSGMGALRKQMELGKVDGELLNKALKELTEEGGQGFGAMEAQSRTLGGMMSNLADTFTNLAGDIGTELLPMFKSLLADFMTFLEVNKEGIIETAVTVFKALGSAVKFVADILLGAVDIYKQNNEMIDSMVKFVALAATGIIAFELAITSWAIVSSLSFASVATAATTAWLAISGPIGAAIIAIGLLAAAYEADLGGVKTSLGGWREFMIGVDETDEEVTNNQMRRSQMRKRVFTNELEAKRIAQEDADAIKAEREALLLEQEQTIKDSLLGIDAVFSEELAMRDTIKREFEAKSAKDKLKFIKDNLGAIKAQEELVKIQALKDQGKFLEASGRLRELGDAARKKALDTQIADEKKAIQQANKEKIKANEELSKIIEDEISKGNERAKAEKLRHEKGQLLTFKSFKQEEKDFLHMTEKERLASTSTGLNALASLRDTKSKEAFAVGKAAAIAQATIDTFTSAQAAFTSLAGIPIVGPGLGIAAAAAATIAGLSRINSISSQQLSFEHGGVVPGSSFTGDNVGANVNSSEMILTRRQQTTLFNMANSGGGGGNTSGLLTAINNLGDRIQNMEITLFADDTAIATSTSRGVQDGIIIGESR